MLRIEPMVAADAHAIAAVDDGTGMDERAVHAELSRAWARSWVAREEEAGVVAFLVSWHVADELHVLNVATRADRRRRGIARALMGEAISYARGNGVRRVLLEVRRSNAAALALYREAGFHETGVRARYYPDGEDAVEMARQL